MHLRLRTLVMLVAAVFVTRSLLAEDRPDTKPDRAGFTAIFDGKSLADWDGDPKYWTVEDGKLVGTVTPETLLKQNSWIV